MPELGGSSWAVGTGSSLLHQVTHIFPSIPAQREIPRSFVPNHTPFHTYELPPLRILDPRLDSAARDYRYNPCQVPNVMELALLGDTVLKTLIIERLQDLAKCGKAANIANISARLNTNILFCYLSMAYDMIDNTRGGSPGQKSYADVFEAYIGALWRESDDTGKAYIRLVVRKIFSPNVFPVIAEWVAGRREFGVITTVKRARDRFRLQEQYMAARRNGSKAMAIGGGGPVRTWRLGRERRSRDRSVPPREVIIDLTNDDDEEEDGHENDGDDSDNDSIVYISESEWNNSAGPSKRSGITAPGVQEEPGFVFDGLPEQTEAEPSSGRTYAIYIDTEPSLLSDEDISDDPPPAVYIDTEPSIISDNDSSSDSVRSASPPSYPTVHRRPPRSVLPPPQPTRHTPWRPIIVHTHDPVESAVTQDPLHSRRPSAHSPSAVLSTRNPATLQASRSAPIASTSTSTHTVAPIASSSTSNPKLIDRITSITPTKLASAVPAMVKHRTEHRSPLRKIGDALGSVKSTVEAAFKRKAAKERMASKRGD